MSSLEDIVARLRDAVIVLDAERHVIGWYGAASRMLGWSEEEVLGKPIDSLLQPKDVFGPHPVGDGNRARLGTEDVVDQSSDEGERIVGLLVRDDGDDVLT